MSESKALAIRDAASPRELSVEIERRRSEARALEIQVIRKEEELRRAKEEQALLKELRTVNEMAVKKRERQQATHTGSGIKASENSLGELRAIQDQLKVEEKKTADLQKDSEVVSLALAEVEQTIGTKTSALSVMKQTTGYDTDVNSARSGVAVQNEYRERKRLLDTLYDERATAAEDVNRLSDEVAAVTEQIEEKEVIAEQIAEAEEQLKQATARHAELLGEVESYERLRKKKEKMLSDSDIKTDDYKQIRQIEGDKKVLHHNLGKLRETSQTSSKSILSLEVHLRQLETRLEAVNLFLKQVFAEVEDSEPIENVDEAATEVPLYQFEDLCRELELSRDTVVQRDDQLDANDAKIEQLERKVLILKSAIVSRAVSSRLRVREKEKNFESLMVHADELKAEFEAQRSKLVDENTQLKTQLQSS